MKIDTVIAQDKQMCMEQDDYQRTTVRGHNLRTFTNLIYWINLVNATPPKLFDGFQWYTDVHETLDTRHS